MKFFDISDSGETWVEVKHKDAQASNFARMPIK